MQRIDLRLAKRSHRLVPACALLAALSLPGQPVRSEPSAAVLAGWEKGARLFFNDAVRDFSQVRSPDGAAREASLGQAVMLLGVQPRTESNLEAAVSLLDQIVAADGSDEVGFAARFYLARIEQIHRPVPDVAKARHHYEELVRVAPGHFFGDLARLKLVILALYGSDSRTSLDERVPEAEAWGREIHDAILRCDYHYVMSRALSRLPGREGERLRHLLAMEQTGQVIRSVTRSLMLIEIGEMARAVGQPAEAARAFRRFLEEFPLDPRSATVRARLREVEAAS